MNSKRLPGGWRASSKTVGPSIARACATMALATILMAVSNASASAEGAHFVPRFGCDGIGIALVGFPDRPGNSVTEIIQIDRSRTITKVLEFNGPTGSDTIRYELGPGHHQLDARIRWDSKLGRGGHDQFLSHGITCSPVAAFSIEKLQALGKKEQFTTEMQFGTRRELVRYEILVSNTGNVALALGALQDARCDPGTLGGGPGGVLGVGDTATYTCTHELTPVDQALGSYENVASLTATPSGGDGPPVTGQSNPVLVQLPHDTVGFGCEAMTFTYTDFPDAPGNTVTEYISLDHQSYLTKTFVFDGPSGSDTVALELTPGKHKLDGRAHWRTNGAHGAHDQSVGGRLTCVAPLQEALS